MINSIHRFFDKASKLFDDMSGHDLEAITTVALPLMMIIMYCIHQLNGAWKFWGM